MTVFLPQPPRLTGDAKRDQPAILDWQWKFFQAIAVDNTVLIESEQFADPSFDGTTLPEPTDPEATTLASAQLIANTAYALIITLLSGSKNGQATVSGAATSIAVTFTTAMTDTNYRVVASASASAGAPAAGAFVVASVTKSTTGFTLAVTAAPGAGTSVTFDWIATR